MQVFFEGHHFQITDAARAYTQSAIEKIERFYSPIIDCHVTLTHENDLYRADMITRVQGQTLKSSDHDVKLYKAVDEAVEKMSRQLRKLHDKRRDYRPAPQVESNITTGE
jgi:putative sigma-54 modulation protein